ncbi:MAG TPA: DUF5605 domain-containing protein [Lacipirellulaceae bacterium]|nr:DUF5605 domain-containing protein [Lacipirellulaceae bacterium]HMP07495.1 DUF5605 domain-containing protein [Lacipirellulaceae bacterium]
MILQRHAALFAIVACWLLLETAATALGSEAQVGVLGPAGVQLGASLEQWDTLDLSLRGPAEGNPFVDVELRATFETAGGDAQPPIEATGFYDGDGTYRVRFCPPTPGVWTFVTHSNSTQLDGVQGEFDVAAATGANHGPVRVHNTFHFVHADGTPYRQLGTTCYGWTSQPEALQEQTLKTLAKAPFNKLRMCVFPKRYTWNENEPEHYAFVGTPPNQWDFTRLNPEFFRRFEQRVLQLRDLGIEADVILLHPYDEGHWGFDRMSADADDRYLRYVVARLAAIRNVWWSLANEYDFMSEKQESDWDRILDVVTAADPYGRLCSIHNGTLIYNHTHPALTHASIQNGSAVEDPGRAVLYRDVYRKPIVFDEVKYEGDIPKRWGNLSAEEMVHRFWCGTVAGTYVGHGECYLSPDDVLWWAKGGVLKGKSPQRLAFLRDILADSPAEGIEPIDKWQHPEYGGQRGEYYLVYLGKATPQQWTFSLPSKDMPDGVRFRVDVIDAWNMTVTSIERVVTVKRKDEYQMVADDNWAIPLPGRPYIALRIVRVDSE